MVYRNKNIGIVVPAFNEEILIGETLKSIPIYADKIYIIDDGSTDKTAEIAKKFMNNDPRFVCIIHKKNKGLGAAIITGYNKALEDGLDIIAVMAGDNQMDPLNLPLLLDPIVDERSEYSKGNRLYSSEFRKGMSKWRFFGNAILTFLTKMASGYWQLMDPQNGYTAISAAALKRIDPDTIYPLYGYNSDILVKLNVNGFRIIDIVMPARYGKEKSKIKYGRYMIKVSWLLLNNFMWRLKMKYIWISFNPLVIFYILGVATTAIGFISEIYILYSKLFLNEPFFSRGIVALLLIIIGIQFLSFAMLFDMQANSNLENLQISRNSKLL